MGFRRPDRTLGRQLPIRDPLQQTGFQTYHYNTDYNTAKFRGDIPQMPADTYTYYAVSPVPSESDGTQATYLIPDVQDGGFNGDWDVMVADPVKAPALEKNDTGETVQFQFRHKVHVLKIRIPKNDLGEKVSEITLAFPQPVTGRMTVDAADPDAAPTLTDGNNTLTLRFDTPKDAGDVVFAVIAPVELTAEQPVTITAICEAGESEPRNIPGKHFSEGHTTPIAYHIPAIGRYYTRLNFSLPADKGTATLGEAVGKITLTAPEGSLFDNGTNVRQFTPDAEGKYTMVLKPSWTDNLSGKAVTVQYESESAVVSNTLTMPQITEFGNNDITLSVPYLLAEDFSNIIQFDYDCNVGTGTSSSSAGNKDAHLLSDKGAIGWTAARVGGETGKCIRSSCRFEGGGAGKASSYARYPGRIDSPPVSGIKSGKTVRVRVSFDYVGGQDSWMMDSNKNKGGTYGNPTFNYGYTTNSGQPNGGDNLENPVEAEDIALETDKSWNTPLSNWNTKTFLADFNSAHRISWKVNVNRIGNVSSWTGIFGANGNQSIHRQRITAMRKLLYLLASAAVMAGGCSEKKETPAGEGCGTIRIACEADATIDAAAAMAAVQGATRAAAKPDGKDFTLRIRGENFDKSWATVAAYNAEETAYSFPEGRYTITVTYGDPEAEGADKPYYAGATEVEVAARRTSTAQITATIGNSQTLVRATESFKKYYNNAEFTVTTGAGGIFTFRPCDEAEAEAVWVQAGKPLTLKGTARGQSQDGTSEGPLYTFTPEPLEAARPATRHIFTLDAKKAGSATLTVTLGEGYTETVELDVELNDEATE